MTASDAAGFYGELTSYVRAPSYSDGARAEVEFNGNVFSETGRLGIVTHDFVHATIQSNTFTKTINDFGYAMELGSRSTATVSGNTISGYDTPAASDGSTSAGIYIENSFTGPAMYPPSGLPHIVKPVTVSNNTLTGNQYGVWIGNEWTGYAGDIDINVTLQGNTISDNTDGGVFIVDEGRSAGSSVTVNASGNDVIDNGDVGYWFNTYGDGELHVDVRNDTITGHGWGAVMTDYPSGTSNSLYDVSVNLSDLSANTVGAENGVAGKTLDTTGNWWGNVSGPYNAANNSDGTGAPVSDDVAYSPWLGIGTDTSGDPGFQPASPMTFIVEPQVCLPVGCIQQGVSLASAGDTIEVHDGTYVEPGQIVISKDLSIAGAGASTTIVKPAGDTGSSGNARGWFLVNSGVTFNLSGVTLDGTGRKVYQAIRHLGQGTVSDCSFKEIKFEESGPAYAGLAMAVFGGPAMNVDVTGCTFSGIGRIGVLYFGPGVTDSTFSGNTYTGKGSGDWLDYAVEVGGGAHAAITDNTISGNTGVADVDGSTSAGIIATTYFGDGTQATIIGNEISSCTTGIGVGYDGSDTSVVTAHLNLITGNTTGVDSTAPIVDALSNWWGDVTGPYHPDTNPFGLGNKVSDYVLFDPWLKGIEYVGDTFVPLGGTANLRARFVNSDDSSPAVAGAEVNFDLVDSDSVPVSGSPFSGITEGTGVASVPVSGLTVDIYTVTARFGLLEDSAQLGVFGVGDSDGDGIVDVLDNCPMVPNPDQRNTDGQPIDNGPVIAGDDLTVPYSDGYGDACDDDDDNDGLTDAFEASGCGSGPTNPLLQDTDGDRVIDGAECLLGSDPNNSNSVPVRYPPNDSDGDGIPANVEAAFGSSDNNKDSDGDGINDAIEINGWGTSPVMKDSNSNGCDENIEIADVNGDGWVNVGDQLIIAQRAGRVRDDDVDPDPPWNFSPAFDVNKDGYINVGDQLLVGKNVGKICQ
jgi:hypothetical protein